MRSPFILALELAAARPQSLAAVILAIAAIAGLSACSDETSGTAATGSSSAAGSSSSSGGSSSAGTGGAGTGGAGGMGTGGAEGGAGGSGGAGGAGGGQANLSDTFDGASLDPSWFIFKPEAVTVAVKNGALDLTLTQAALWFNASQGVLVYKPITGDFIVTTTAHARKASNPAVPPDAAVHLGGLMARDPKGVGSGGQENYVFIVVGRDENDLSVETKTTVNSASNYVGPSWPSGDAELRICRIGSLFSLYKRPVGGSTWELAISYTRADLPNTLQVGVNIYALNAPDLNVTFDEVLFGVPADQAACAADGP